MDNVLGGAANYAGLKTRPDDDVIDRLSHHYSTVMLIIFTVVVSTKQYVGEPIKCWCPGHFTDTHTAYTDYVCWVSNTYHVPFEAPIPLRHDVKMESEIVYYQWVPIILLLQALMFKIPRIMWRILVASSGVSLEKVITLASECQYKPSEERERIINHIVIYLDKWFSGVKYYRPGCLATLREKIARYCCIVCGRRYGNHLVTASVITKAIYVMNAISHLYILNAFLGTDYHLYGFQILDKLYRGEDWMESRRFPRVTLCDFQIRQLQNVQEWTVQCVLPINLFNEKIFMFLWFWIVAVAIASSMNFVCCVYSLFLPVQRRNYLKKYLHMHKLIQSEYERKLATRFVDRYLRQDGVYVLRQISQNGNAVVSSEVIVNLWRLFRERAPGFKVNHDPEER